MQGFGAMKRNLITAWLAVINKTELGAARLYTLFTER